MSARDDVQASARPHAPLDGSCWRSHAQRLQATAAPRPELTGQPREVSDFHPANRPLAARVLDLEDQFAAFRLEARRRVRRAVVFAVAWLVSVFIVACIAGWMYVEPEPAAEPPVRDMRSGSFA